MSDIKYILFTGSMQPKNPMKATDDKLKELSRVGYRQGTDYDIVSLKVLEDMLGGKKFAHGGMMNMDEMIRPLGYAAGGPFPPEDNVLEKLKKNDPDKELRDKGILPSLREKEGGTLLSSGMHPLVVFKEMYDQYRIDGGEMSFKEFFDMIQIELNKEASS